MNRKTDKIFYISKDENSTSASDKPKEIVIQLSNKLKYITAIVIFYGSITFGCAFSTYESAIASFQNKYDVDESTISTIFTILTCAYLIGALCGGVIYNYVNRQLVVIIIFSVMAMVMLGTPHIPNLTTFFMSAAVMGICCGSYDVAQLVWMIEMMQKDCAPFVFAQNFFYTIGKILSTLIIVPFQFRPTDVYEVDKIRIAFSLDDFSRLVIPYTIIGSLVATAALAQMLLFIFMRYRPPTLDILKKVEKFSDDVKKETKIDKIMECNWPLEKIGIFVLSAIFLAAYKCMEVYSFELFSNRNLNPNLILAQNRGVSYLTFKLSDITVAYAFGRGFGILIALDCCQHNVLIFNIMLIIIASKIAILFTNNSVDVKWSMLTAYGIVFRVIVILILLRIFKKYRPLETKNIGKVENVKDKKDETSRNIDKNIKPLIVKNSLYNFQLAAFVFTLVIVYIGIEIGLFELFSTFGPHLRIPVEKLTLNTIWLNAVYAVIRGLGIIIALKIFSNQTLDYVMVISLIINFMCFISLNTVPVFWCCGIMLGIGFSTVYPAFCVYIKNYLRFSNFTGVFLITCGPGMEKLYLLIVRNFLETNLVVFGYIAFFSVTLILLSFGGLSYLANKIKARH